MKKFNRKFNNSCSRYKFWIALETHFAGFQELLKPDPSLTSEDHAALREIHALLFKACQIVTGRKEKGRTCLKPNAISRAVTLHRKLEKAVLEA